MKKFFVILTFWLACLVPSIPSVEAATALTEPTEKPVVLGAMGCGKLAEIVGLMAIAENQKDFKSGNDLIKFIPPSPKFGHQIVDLLRTMANVVVKFREVSPDEHFDGAYEFCKAYGGNVPEMNGQLRKMLGEVDI